MLNGTCVTGRITNAMAHIIIDRRLNDKRKSSVNRRRFLERVKQRTRTAVKKAISEGKIEDIAGDRKEKVNVPIKDISEPTFSHDRGGIVERIFPGNQEFITGDRIQRPPPGAAGIGGEGSAAAGVSGRDGGRRDQRCTGADAGGCGDGHRRRDRHRH